MSLVPNVEDDRDLKDQNFYFDNISTEESVSILYYYYFISKKHHLR